MKNKRIAVVGGGISGIFAALLYSKKGFKVTLIEKENKLGGLLCSQNLFKENLSFDFGTHFLRQTGIKEIDEILYDELEVTQFNYIKSGTFYKTLYAKNGFLSDQKIPQREEYFKQLVNSNINEEPTNLKEQLVSDFGEGYTKNLITPIIQKLFFTLPENLSVNSHALFGLNRICASNIELTNKLKLLKRYDNVLAYHSFTEGISSLKNMYPSKGGVGKWIEKLEEKLILSGVNILKGQKIIDIEIKGDKILSINTDIERIEIEELAWTIPIFFLLQKLNIRLSSPPPKRLTSYIFHYLIDQNYLSDLFYIQCFDPSLKSFRITLYDNFSKGLPNKKRISVEVLVENDHQDTMELKSKVFNELKQMKIIPNDTIVLNSFENIYSNGFPVLTKDFIQNSRAQTDLVLDTLSNLQIFGKANGNSWFMNDILKEVYNSIS